MHRKFGGESESEVLRLVCWNHVQNILSSQHFLHHVTGHAVEKKSEHSQQQESSENPDDQPLVLCAEQLFNGLISE